MVMWPWRELDSNQDGVISSDDAAFADLRVWVDGNSDGVSTGGEIKSLTRVGRHQLQLECRD